MSKSNITPRAAWSLFGACALSCAAAVTLAAPTVASRVTAPIDLRDTIALAGNTHPLARAASDRGLVAGQQQLGPLFIVLKRSPEQERDLAAFNARQYDSTSPDYHHWLQPTEFGLTFGPSDADVAAVTGWLASSGFKVLHVSPGRISIEFSGTAAQVDDAFHVQMHRYIVNGAAQISNDRDPQVPRALTPVVAGVSGLNDFPLQSDIVPGTYAKADAASGRLVPYAEPAPSAASLQAAPPPVGGNPQFTVHDGTPLFEFVAPYDLATIYNSKSLWDAGIDGTGVTIGIVGQTDNGVTLSDLATYRSSFGLPPNVPSIEYVGSNPGGSSFANTVILEMAGAAAPGAKLVLVVPEGGTGSSGAVTIGGFLSAIETIVEHNNVNIVSAGFSSCELFLGTSNNAMVTGVWQQAATQGLSIVTSTGNGGSAACDSLTRLDTFGLQVSGIASSPFVTAVGGTDLGWDWLNDGSAYWNTTNGAGYASAKGYIPEFPWNVSCANALVENEFIIDGKPRFPTPIDVCNAIENSPTYSSLVTVEGGGGGSSHCTSLTTSGGCAAGSGYAKPSWQAGTGVPADGKRDLPDIALFASAGWPAVPGSSPPTPLIQDSAGVFCYSGGGRACKYDTYGDIIFQASGGTALSAAYFAGILAMVEQKHGGTRQGLVNPALYKLFGKESLSACNTLTVKLGNSCSFYDVAVALTNAQPCQGGSTAACDDASSVSGENFAIGVLTGYTANTGYDQATGLGSVNIANLVDNWASVAPAPTISVSASKLAFGSVADGKASAPQTLTVKNTGSVVVSFTSGGIMLAGAQAAEFSKTTTCGSTLVVGGSCTITVAFKPTAVGSASATLSIADNATGSPQKVALSGTGSNG
jgi:subtilase family serine protease